MPVTLANLKKKIGTLTMWDEDGDENALHLKYRLITDTTIDDLLKDEDKKTPEERIRDAAVQFVDNVIEWDWLQEKGGEPVPLEPNALCATIPYDAMIMILRAVREDRYNPNLTKNRVQ